LEISKIFSLSAAARLYLFLISGGGLEIFKIFSVSAVAAVFFWEKSAAAAAQPIGLHLYPYFKIFLKYEGVRGSTGSTKVYLFPPCMRCI
jgi:hypothetical protein